MFKTRQRSQQLTQMADFELKHAGLYLHISAHRVFNTLKRHSRGPRAIMYFKKRGMVSGQVMLLYSSYSSFTRAVGVSRRWQDNGGDLSDLSASIVARRIINVHL